jgi:hypothetical protein
MFMQARAGMERIALRSGLGDGDGEEAVVTAATRLLTPCLEAAAVIAAEYAKACGRDVLLSQDFEYGLKFAARHVLGRQTESFFPSDDEEDSDGDELLVDGMESEWTRYDGADERLRMVNAAAETWDEWSPETPVEQALKASIDNTIVR